MIPARKCAETMGLCIEALLTLSGCLGMKKRLGSILSPTTALRRESGPFP